MFSFVRKHAQLNYNTYSFRVKKCGKIVKKKKKPTKNHGHKPETTYFTPTNILMTTILPFLAARES